jgi:hypothetical protein
LAENTVPRPAHVDSIGREPSGDIVQSRQTCIDQIDFKDMSQSASVATRDYRDSGSQSPSGLRSSPPRDIGVATTWGLGGMGAWPREQY